ncbi:MAG TPA: TonB-dependent receptor [Chitinophagaceae bacterium]|jgi:outer membrane receptor protein involved in Fe transport|nr:TonB-dependent receptor [Chitinophagaceae bacterium]
MRPFYVVLILLFVSATVSAQQGSIRGYINDADLKVPITGASVNISGSKGDNSDMFGMFTIAGVNPGQYEMTVSHIGYKTEIINVEVRPDLLSSVNVNLKKANLDLSEVKVNAKKSSALNTISAVDIKLRPVNTSQDVLRIVPGLFIAQHAGGGKAEQIFLRGFDIDHGTDISISVDGMPVNMVSHAHGQGYADLHFLIPETVEKVNFDKGPYNAAKGNLATSAFVDFSTKDFLEHNSLKIEAGQFNTQRAFGQLKLFNKQTEKSSQQFYIASEYSTTDGYFESPQDFHRFNVMGKYSAWFGNQSQLTILASTFDSKWNASGQVPDRAVKAGIIGCFGAIDNTEGGNTSRTNITIKYNHQRKSGWKATDQLYFSRYKFNLYSNFTFFLEDPVDGDMINQREGRNIFGFATTETKSYFIGNKKATTEIGAGLRMDDVKDIALAKAPARIFKEYIQLGDVKEFNGYVYVNQDLELSDKWNLNAALRYDNFKFQYKDKLAGVTAFGKQKRGILSPKLNLSYAPNQRVKLYLNNGFGFHSNDTRLILANDAKEILPRVIGTDLGMIIKPGKNLVLKTALWHLYSQQEFVYVGDAGVVEPSGKTRRMGLDVSARYQFNKWLFGDIDMNFTRARAIGETKGEDYVPLAPSLTSIGGITARTGKGFSGSLRYRLIGERPANEDNSVKAEGYFLLDMVAAYRFKKFEFQLSVENMLNREWREAQFDTESKLKFETDPVSEIHYTPGTPSFIKAGITFNF